MRPVYSDLPKPRRSGAMMRMGWGWERRGRKKWAYMDEDMGQPCRNIRVKEGGFEGR